MNMKLKNEIRSGRSSFSSFNVNQRRKSSYLIKEERRRTGRFIAILVGILLFLLAIYHAWVRRIPIVASLVVPALIMFVYVGWVLYTASRDKHKLMDLEAAMQAALEEENDLASCGSRQDTSSVSKASSISTPETIRRKSSVISPPVVSNNREQRVDQNIIANNNNNLIKPIILINDQPPEDLDQKWRYIVQVVSDNNRLRAFTPRTKFKRKFCRSSRAVFKRSYSIA